MPNDKLRRFPAVTDLAQRAKRRVPHFAWEFLASGTGADHVADRNLTALADVQLTPRFMQGEMRIDPSTELFGTKYHLPFGIAPVGMSSLIWPQSEQALARVASQFRIPYALSTAASSTPEKIGPLCNGMGWFQLYPPRSANIRKDLLERAADAGFSTLLLTVDVPVMSRRERQARAGVSSDAGLTLTMLQQCLMRPTWSLKTWLSGRPGIEAIAPYAPNANPNEFLAFVGEQLNGTLDWQYLEAVRKEWAGPIVLKGILDPNDARRAVDVGVDGIGVSNHGGRQLDAAPAAIERLPLIADAIAGKAKIVFDSGIRSGLDVAKAIALGADFVLAGRAFMYGLGALGSEGAEHTATIIKADLVNAMGQLGCRTLPELRERIN